MTEDSSLQAVGAQPIYRRVLLKLSGEALQGDQPGVDPVRVMRVCHEIATVVQMGVEVALVIGGGNLVRGADFFTGGVVDRVTADQMGMMATVINGLALRDALEKKSVSVRMFSALPVPGLVDVMDRLRVNRALKKGRAVIFVGGTGNPLVTTDSAAALRGIETNADIILKGTKVDGVFAADPVKNPKAMRYDSLTYDEVLEQRLGVMDLTAILMCRDHDLLLRVFNINRPQALLQIVTGQAVGTLVGNGGRL